jgi:hypothetical protein
MNSFLVQIDFMYADKAKHLNIWTFNSNLAQATKEMRTNNCISTQSNGTRCTIDSTSGGEKREESTKGTG